MAHKPRRIFNGVRRAQLTRLKKLILSIMGADGREQNLAATQQRPANVFADNARVTQAMQKLVDQAANKLTEKA